MFLIRENRNTAHYLGCPAPHRISRDVISGNPFWLTQLAALNKIVSPPGVVPRSSESPVRHPTVVRGYRNGTVEYWNVGIMEKCRNKPNSTFHYSIIPLFHYSLIPVFQSCIPVLQSFY